MVAHRWEKQGSPQSKTRISIQRQAVFLALFGILNACFLLDFQIIKKIAKTNRVEINEQEISEMVESIAKTQREEDMKRNIGFWTLFQKYRLAK